MSPRIEKRPYGISYDYVITFNDYPSLSFDCSILKSRRWICVKIHKRLQLKNFWYMLHGFGQHKNFTNDKYWLFFNNSALNKLPYVDPKTGYHEHIKIKIYVANTVLKIQPRFARNYYDVSGGVEYGETPSEAASRELKEELGIIAECKYKKSKESFIKIPILDAAIPTIMHYFELNYDEPPAIKINKLEINNIRYNKI